MGNKRLGKKSGVAVALRGYQETTVNAVLRDYRKALARAGRTARAGVEEGRVLPFCRPLVVLPTGSGKSVCFLELASRVLYERGWRTLVVVPSKRLVRQIVEAARRMYPGLRSGPFVKARRNLDDYDLVVTTAAGIGPKWRAKIGSDYFGLVVYDEAHHLPAKTYKSIFRHFCGAEIACGFSATPKRGSGESVADSDEYFTHIVSYFSMSQLTAEGYLSPVRGVFVDTEVSLAGVPVSCGEYVEAALSRVVNTTERNALVVSKWRLYAGDLSGGRVRPTLVFAVDVRHAKDLAECFNLAGVSARAVWGEMSDDELEAAVDDFMADRVSVLVNVRLFTEGVDLPKTSCVLNARPMTQESLAVLGSQIVGRGTRLSPETGKVDCCYIEFLDRDGGVSAAAAGGKRVRGGRGRMHSERESGVGPRTALHAAYNIGDCVLESDVPVHLQARAYEEKRAWYERQLELLSAREGGGDLYFDIAERVAQASYFTWMPLGTRAKFMMLGSGDYIELFERDRFSFELRIVFEGRLVERVEYHEKGQALSFANRWLRKHYVEAEIRLRVDEDGDDGWRMGPPSPLHVGQAHSLTGLPFEYLERMTMGQVCDLITTVRSLEAEPSEIGVGLLVESAVWRDPMVQMGLSFA